MQSQGSTGYPSLSIDQLIRFILVIILVCWSYLLVRPFFGFLTWSCILAISLHPAYERVNKRMGDHRVLTATLFTIAGIIIILSTLGVLTNTLVVTIANFKDQFQPGQPLLPHLPEYVAGLPGVGGLIQNAWDSISLNLGQLLTQYADDIVKISKVVLATLAQKAFSLVIFILSMGLSGYLLIHSDRIVKTVAGLVHRITPKLGEGLITLMQETVQNVSIGVIGVALLQSVLFGSLLLLIGVPAVGILTLLAVILSIAQLGLILLIIPIVIWLFLSYSVLAASVYTVLFMLIGILDNLLKPFVLSRGLRTPMSLIFIGIVGGLLLHGLVGIFIGPVILAVVYDLLNCWLVEDDKEVVSV